MEEKEYSIEDIVLGTKGEVRTSVVRSAKSGNSIGLHKARTLSLFFGMSIEKLFFGDKK